MGGYIGRAIDTASRDPLESMAFVADPGGLIQTSKNEDIAKFQGKLDIGGYGAKPEIAAREAEKATAKQEAKIKKQEAKIEAERKKQQAVIDERAGRMAKNQLLSGAETGTTGSTSLLSS